MIAILNNPLMRGIPNAVEIKLEADNPTNQNAASLKYGLCIVSPLIVWPSLNLGGVPFR